MGMTSYLQKKLGDHSIGKGSWTMPTTTYLCLFTGNPGEAGTLTSEVAGGSYARQAITAAMSAFDATTGIAVNASAITYPAPTAAWGAIAYLGIADASSAGNLLYYEALPSARVINSGDPAPTFAAGAVQLSLS